MYDDVTWYTHTHTHTHTHTQISEETVQRQRYAEVKLHGHATDPKARRGVEDPKTRAEERLMQLALKGERKKKKKEREKKGIWKPQNARRAAAHAAGLER